MSEPLIKLSINLTPRVVSAVGAEAKRLQIRDGEVYRRILDQWADDAEHSVKPLSLSRQTA